MNKIEINKRVLIGIFGLFSFWILAYFFIPECDDLYFQYWEFATIKDFIHTIPLQENVASVPNNGRYLGNALGIIVSKLEYFGANWFRAFLLGGALWLFCFCSGLYENSRIKASRFLLAFSAIVLAPVSLWQNVISWSASFCNYFIPIIFMVFEIYIFRRKSNTQYTRYTLFFLAIIGQLFSETFTVFMVMLAGMMVSLAFYNKRRNQVINAIFFMAGTLFGACIMFSDMGYLQVGNDAIGRSFGFEMASKTIVSILKDTICNNIFFIPIGGILLSQNFINSKKKGLRICSKYTFLCTCFFMVLFLVEKIGYRTISCVKPVLSIFTMVLFLVLIINFENQDRKRWILIWIMCYLGTIGLLTAINPVSPRHYFLNYVILFMIILEIYEEIGWLPKKTLMVVSVICMVFFYVIYGKNYLLNRYREDVIYDAMKEHKKEICLPLVPYPEYTINETTAKGDISYVYYYDKPWDIKFTFVDYNDWDWKNE